MKIPLKKTLSALLTNFFVKHSMLAIYSDIYKVSAINLLKLNFVRACAKFRFLSKNSFFFNLKYPVYILLVTANTDFFKLNTLSLVFFQFYKYIAFSLNSKNFFDTLFLNQYIKSFNTYLNAFSLSILKKK
jgi:hypothetical protein